MNKEQTEKYVREEGSLTGKEIYCQALGGYFWLRKGLKVEQGLEERAYHSRT